MKSFILFFILTATFTVQSEVITDLTRCTQMTNKENRLDCFDTVAAYYKQNRVLKSNNNTVLPSPVENDTIVVSKQDSFGKSTAEITNIDKIESYIVGEFNGWVKGSIITLENNQKWKVISSTKGYSKMKNPKVVIERGFWGSFNMKVEGLNSKAKVKRVD